MFWTFEHSSRPVNDAVDILFESVAWQRARACGFGDLLNWIGALVLVYHGSYLVIGPTVGGRSKSNGLVSMAMMPHLVARSFWMVKEREPAQRYPRDEFGWDIVLEFVLKVVLFPPRGSFWRTCSHGTAANSAWSGFNISIVIQASFTYAQDPPVCFWRSGMLFC